MTIQEFINKYNELEGNLPIVNWIDCDSSSYPDNRIAYALLIGVATPEQNKELALIEDELSWSWYCGCEHDCCGCLSSESVCFTKISRGKTRVYFHQSFNY